MVGTLFPIQQRIRSGASYTVQISRSRLSPSPKSESEFPAHPTECALPNDPRDLYPRRQSREISRCEAHSSKLPSIVFSTIHAIAYQIIALSYSLRHGAGNALRTRRARHHKTQKRLNLIQHSSTFWFEGCRGNCLPSRNRSADLGGAGINPH
jgi:hypothetical protein